MISVTYEGRFFCIWFLLLKGVVSGYRVIRKALEIKG